jgi:peptide/nickel transport system substrate-binding protein
MRRRTFLKTAMAAAALPAPAIAQSDRSSLLTFVPRTGLDVLDPVITTSTVSGNHGYYIFDTLYGVDDKLRPSPQMAEGHTVSDDRLIWTIGLRDGLKWHNGERVLARDCVASLRRWSARDAFGRLLARTVDAWEVVDDRTLRIRLKQPFEVLPDALAHPQAAPAFMMPEHLARTPPTEPVKEMIGSGPMRFLADEFLQGDHVAYARFADYVPRSEPAQGTAGGKHVYFERVHWKIIPDDSTAAAGIQTGEIDWWEFVNPDQIALLQKNAKLRVDIADPLGTNIVMRFNTIVPPFDNVKLRRVILESVNQADFMASIAGDVPGNWRNCYSQFACGLPGVQEVGEAAMKGPKDFAKLREAVKASGYNGERVVLISAANYSLTAGLAPVAADLFQKIGLNVDFQPMDYGAWMQRRTSRETTDKGGWSVILTQGTSAVTGNPALNVFAQGDGKAGFTGWYDNPQVMALTRRWTRAADETERLALTNQIQRIVFDDAPTIPLGLLYPRTVMQHNLEGFLPGVAAVPWNIRRV